MMKRMKTNSIEEYIRGFVTNFSKIIYKIDRTMVTMLMMAIVRQHCHSSRKWSPMVSFSSRSLVTVETMSILDYLVGKQ